MDGIPLAGGYEDFNPDDVQSMEVLKDATAIYGARGANGVVIISTKRGLLKGKKKTIVSYDNYVGQSSVLKQLTLFSGTEFAEYVRESRRGVAAGSIYKDANGVAVPTGVQNDFADSKVDVFDANVIAGIKAGRNTQYQDFMLRTGTIQNHSLGVQGGDDKTSFYIGGSYFKDIGVSPGLDYTRMTLRANIDHQITDRVKVGISTFGMSSIRNGANWNPYAFALQQNPLGTPYKDPAGSTTDPANYLFSQTTAMKRDVFYGRPFKRLRPTKYLIETAFADKTNDSRFKKSFRDTWLCNNPPAAPVTSFALDASKAGQSITFRAGDTAIYISPVEIPVAERALRKYQVVVPSFSSATGFYNEAIFFTLQKFFDTKRPDLTYTHGSRDYFVFRLADTKLLLAEAYLLSGKRPEALAQINDVRTRAAFAGKTADMQITDAQLSMDFIMEERARELAGEQMRWMDLKRWGKLVERVKLHNPQAAPYVKDMHYVRPIPQTQIDRTEGGATAFPQNAGY